MKLQQSPKRRGPGRPHVESHKLDADLHIRIDSQLLGLIYRRLKGRDFSIAVRQILREGLKTWK